MFTGQENFTEVAKSRDVEVLDGKSQWIDLAGNLTPIAKSGEQLRLKFHSFRENRLPFLVRVRDINADAVARITFSRDSKSSGKADLNPVCNLNIVLPAKILPDEPSAPHSMTSSPRLPMRMNHNALKNSAPNKLKLLSFEVGQIHKADLKISDIANLLESDWVILAEHLGIDEADIGIIETEYPGVPHQQATVMLRLWMQQAGEAATGNTLEKALNLIGRTNILSQCIGNVAPVTDDTEKVLAHTHVDFKRREASRTQDKRNLSLDVCFDEQDIMKDSESVEDVSQSDFLKNQSKFESASPDEYVVDVCEDPMVSSYEREEQKYTAEEKDCSKKSSGPDAPGQDCSTPTLLDDAISYETSIKHSPISNDQENNTDRVSVSTRLLQIKPNHKMNVDESFEQNLISEEKRFVPVFDNEITEANEAIAHATGFEVSRDLNLQASEEQESGVDSTMKLYTLEKGEIETNEKSVFKEHEVLNVDEATAVAVSLVSEIESDIMKISLSDEENALLNDSKGEYVLPIAELTSDQDFRPEVRHY